MTQKFKGLDLTRTQVKNNILKVWDYTTNQDRHDWYQEAHEYAVQLIWEATDVEYRHAARYDKPRISKACGVISALSPMVLWKVNKRLAWELIVDQHGEGWEDLKCLKANAKKAWLIIQSDGSDDAILGILKGQKTSAFYLNIRYPEKAICLTIDRHALSIALGVRITKDNDELFQMTAKQYEFFQECYRWTAAKIGVSPLILQSATWLLWRREKRNYNLPLTLNL